MRHKSQDYIPKKNVGIFIDQTQAIRNFIESDAFSDMQDAFNVYYILPEKLNKRIVEPAWIEERLKPIRISIPQKRYELWTQISLVRQLRYRPGKYYKKLRKMRTRNIGIKASLYLRFLSLPVVYSVYTLTARYFLCLHKFTELTELLNTYDFDIILHPTTLSGLFINDLILTARHKGIDLIALLNSWDNPSTKASIVGSPSLTLVWGEQTRQHAIKYAQIPEDSVLVFGAAQFDIYKNKVDRECAKIAYGFTKNDTVILFAGSSLNIDELQYLTCLDNFLHDLSSSNIYIIYRPYVYQMSSTLAQKILAYKFTHVRLDSSTVELLETTAKGTLLPYPSSYSFTKQLLDISDIIISPLSTILLEGLLNGVKPICIYPDAIDDDFSPQNSPLVHFEDFLALPVVSTVTNIHDLLLALVALLYDDNCRSTESLRNYSQPFVEMFEHSYSIRLRKLIESRLSR